MLLYGTLTTLRVTVFWSHGLLIIRYFATFLSFLSDSLFVIRYGLRFVYTCLFTRLADSRVSLTVV